MSAKWQEKITGMPQYADYSKMVDALKVVVRREQILVYFYILLIKIQFGNKVAYWQFLIHSFIVCWWLEWQVVEWDFDKNVHTWHMNNKLWIMDITLLMTPGVVTFILPEFSIFRLPVLTVTTLGRCNMLSFWLLHCFFRTSGQY